MRRVFSVLILAGWAGVSAAATDLTCIMPFSFVDRWTDTNANSKYDDGEPYDPSLTGLVAPADVGRSLTLTAANPTSIVAGTYLLVALPPLGYGTPPQVGETWLRKWVSECAPYGVASGDSLVLEPGTLFPALLEELAGVISSDSTAYWDEATKTVKGSAFGASPRLLAVSCFDPRYPPTSAKNYVIVAKIAVVFLEEVAGPTTVQVRFVDSHSATVAIKAKTWGRIKSEFGERR